MKTLLCSLTLLLAALPGLSQAQTEPVQIKDRLDVAPVFSGAWQGFPLLTDTAHNRQYVAYYNPDRYLTVASRTLDSRAWTTQVLPSQVNWDSHKYITLALDRDGQLHVSGNMHCDPLVYFRTSTPGDITTLHRIGRMTGQREFMVTYPQFLTDNDGSLLFTYREGFSGGGDTIYNRYDEKTHAWTRLLDQPLFSEHRPASIPRPAWDHDDLLNAYPAGPVHGPDGWWHITWVWRDTIMAETCHDLSYARSRDLVHWETINGRPITLPITLDTPGVIIDPIPAHGGIVNGAGRIGFDPQGRVVISYWKFESSTPDAATQVYLARAETGKWDIHQLTRWHSRWEPLGGGTITFDVTCSNLRNDPRLGSYIQLNNTREGSGFYKVDASTLALGAKIPAVELPDYVPASLARATSPDMKTHLPGDRGTPPPGVRYVLRWESMPIHRDHAWPGHENPPPSMLQVITLADAK